MSIPYLEIDCQNANHPGQIGVAVGRATSVSGLRILNFSPSMCQKHPQKVYDYQDCESDDNFLDSLDCCRKKPYMVSGCILAESKDENYLSDSEQ